MKSNDEQLYNLLTMAHIGILVHRQGKILYANPYAAEKIGFAHVDDLIGQEITRFIHPEELPEIARRIENMIARAVDYHDIEERYVRIDGQIINVNVSAKPIEYDGGQAIMVVVQDITRHKQTEERLQAIYQLSARTTGTEFFHALVLSITSTLNVRVAFVAKFSSTQPASAYSLAISVGKELVENMQWSLSGTPCEQVAKGKKVFIAKGAQASFPDDQWLSELGLDSYMGIPMTDSHGHVIGHIGIMDDKPIQTPQEIEKILSIFSDRTAAELERKQSDLLINQTANILGMIATGQPAPNIYDAIALMYEARHPGMRCSMLLLKGNKLMHGAAPSLPPEYSSAMNGLQNGPNIGSCGTSTYTGKPVLVEDIATDPKWADLKNIALPHGLRSCWSEPIKSIDGKVLGAFGMYYNHPALPDKQELNDLQSAAKLAGIVMEKEQKEKDVYKLSQAIEQAGESIVITDRDGIIEYANPAFIKLTGYTAEEAIGQTPRLLNSGNQDLAFYEEMWKTISNENVWRGKIIDRKKDGSFYPATLTISPIFTKSGSAKHHTHYVGIQSDLTTLENMEDQFYQSQKMEALGTLVGGIAHDFNNMLAGMTGNLYLARKKVQDNPDVVQKLANVERLSFRAADMIKQLLTFARKDKVDIKQIPLNPFIKEILKLLRASVPENIGTHQEICKDTLLINGDATQLHQAIMNMISNACDAVENVDEPCITVRLESFQPDDALIAVHSYFKAMHYAHLRIEDNGCGIPEDQIKHLFEPFFTTKEVGKGTGLGLAMVFGAIKTHHGYVEVESIEGEGTTFHIYLPLLEIDEMASTLPQDEVIVEGSGETILLVDDEAHVLETGREVLESLGYQVLVASDGIEAIEVFTEHQDEISLIITDLVMPRLGGVKAIGRIRKICPGIKVIFSTGYDKDASLPDAIPRGDIPILSKPYNIEELSKTIQKQLES